MVCIIPRGSCFYFLWVFACIFPLDSSKYLRAQTTRDHYCSCLPKFYYWGPRDPGPPGHPGGLARWVDEFQSCFEFRGRTGQGSRLISGGGYENLSIQRILLGDSPFWGKSANVRDKHGLEMLFVTCQRAGCPSHHYADARGNCIECIFPVSSSSTWWFLAGMRFLRARVLFWS